MLCFIYSSFYLVLIYAHQTVDKLRTLVAWSYYFLLFFTAYGCTIQTGTRIKIPPQKSVYTADEGSSSKD